MFLVVDNQILRFKATALFCQDGFSPQSSVLHVLKVRCSKARNICFQDILRTKPSATLKKLTRLLYNIAFVNRNTITNEWNGRFRENYISFFLSLFLSNMQDR